MFLHPSEKTIVHLILVFMLLTFCSFFFNFSYLQVVHQSQLTMPAVHRSVGRWCFKWICCKVATICMCVFFSCIYVNKKWIAVQFAQNRKIDHTAQRFFFFFLNVLSMIKSREWNRLNWTQSTFRDFVPNFWFRDVMSMIKSHCYAYVAWTYYNIL